MIVSPRRRLIRRLNALLDAQDLELDPGQLKAMVLHHCGQAKSEPTPARPWPELEEASDAGLEALERRLYDRYAEVVTAKRHDRQRLEDPERVKMLLDQLTRRPLAKVRPEEPPAERKETG